MHTFISYQDIQSSTVFSNLALQPLAAQALKPSGAGCLWTVVNFLQGNISLLCHACNTILAALCCCKGKLFQTFSMLQSCQSLKKKLQSQLPSVFASPPSPDYPQPFNHPTMTRVLMSSAEDLKPTTRGPPSRFSQSKSNTTQEERRCFLAGYT